MVNLWYDFETDSDWPPYVGSGLGLIRIDQGDVSYGTNKLAEEIATLLARQQHPQAPVVPFQSELYLNHHQPIPPSPIRSVRASATRYRIPLRSISDTVCRLSTAWSSPA